MLSIETEKDLNKFVALFGDIEPENIISKLEERYILVSEKVAKLLLDNKLSHTS